MLTISERGVNPPPPPPFNNLTNSQRTTVNCVNLTQNINKSSKAEPRIRRLSTEHQILARHIGPQIALQNSFILLG